MAVLFRCWVDGCHYSAPFTEFGADGRHSDVAEQFLQEHCADAFLELSSAGKLPSLSTIRRCPRCDGIFNTATFDRDLLPQQPGRKVAAPLPTDEQLRPIVELLKQFWPILGTHTAVAKAIAQEVFRDRASRPTTPTVALAREQVELTANCLFGTTVEAHKRAEVVLLPGFIPAMRSDLMSLGNSLADLRAALSVADRRLSSRLIELTTRIDALDHHEKSIEPPESVPAVTDELRWGLAALTARVEALERVVSPPVPHRKTTGRKLPPKPVAKKDARKPKKRPPRAT